MLIALTASLNVHRELLNLIVKQFLSITGWVSSFLTAHQHIIGYSVPPYNGLENAIKDGKYNQGYLATIKYE